jgi:hypothetical protein
MFEGRLTTQYCEAGENTKIQRVASDYMHSNIAYALTEANEIIVYEAKQGSGTGKTDTVECKSNIIMIDFYSNGKN